MSEQYKKFQPNDILIDDNASAYTCGPEIQNARRYSISRSGRYKQIIKHREALDETLFDDQDKVIDYNESANSTSSSSNNNNNNNISRKTSNPTLSRKSYTEVEIEAWIENSFRQTLDGYKTLRRKSNASIKSNTMVNSDGHLETAL